MGGTCCKSRKEDQVAKATLWLPWFMVDQFLTAIGRAEELLGTPPNTFEIAASFKQISIIPLQNPQQAAAIILSLFREDIIFADRSLYHFTCTPREGFSKFSDRFREIYQGYRVDSIGCIVPDTEKTLNYKELIKVLKSKDADLFNQSKWMFAARFLDGGDLENNSIAFTSYARSGNSMLRKILEQISGVATGGTMPLITSTSL